MKKRLSILLLALGFQQATQTAAVTYKSSGGRFGDQLVAYTHARWVAYKYNLPLLYIPFDYADKLMVNTMHQKMESDSYNKIEFPMLTKYGEKVQLDSIIKPAENNLYVIPYFPESSDELTRVQPWRFDLDWEDERFIQILRQELSPIEPLQKLILPNDRISLAVHMRRGGGWHVDVLLQEAKEINPKIEYADVATPLKFVPFEYYVDQIIKVSELLDNRPIYVHIFTDDKNPGMLVEKCKAAVNKPNILFGSRESDNCHDANVLDDFFALTQFDCLIRGDSNFSLMAAKLGHYKIQIAPKSYVWRGTKLIITEVNINQKNV